MAAKFKGRAKKKNGCDIHYANAFGPPEAGLGKQSYHSLANLPETHFSAHNDKSDSFHILNRRDRVN